VNQSFGWGIEVNWGNIPALIEEYESNNYRKFLEFLVLLREGMDLCGEWTGF